MSFFTLGGRKNCNKTEVKLQKKAEREEKKRKKDEELRILSLERAQKKK